MITKNLYKKIIKKFIPDIILKHRERIMIKLMRLKFSKMKTYDVFKEIYLNKLWSPDPKKQNDEFYSGPGSHFPEFVINYINEIEKFLLSLPEKPNVVDLGCGDFVIGSKIRPADQIIQPYEHGDPFQKSTCLWLKNLPKLEPTKIVPLTYITTPNGHRYTKGWYQTPRNSTDRSRTFMGIAIAMADQWGDLK